ncbi:hypothetical protein ACFQ2M_25895 [Kitasatospora saccharophila]|uniref:hypothetical protein n=1 Tax=Kitasatospora saccharophila TaxID=407973 RepID=UPI003625BC70
MDKKELRTTLRWLAPVLPAAAMLALAVGLNQRAILFPEAIALAFGVWVMHRPAWIASPTRMVAGPVLCAVDGILVAQLFHALHWSKWAAAAVALLIALAVLQLLAAPIGPAVSAAVLPVVFSLRTWDYPLAVLCICAAIAAVMFAIEQGRAPAPAPMVAAGAWRVDRLLVLGAVSGGWLLVSGVLLDLPPVAVAPPLMVSALEWAMLPARTLQLALKRGVLLCGGCAVGSLALWTVPQEWVGGALAVAVVCLAARYLGEPHAPAMAMALVPYVAHEENPAVAGFGAAAGTVVTYAAISAVLALTARPRPGAPAPDAPVPTAPAAAR